MKEIREPAIVFESEHGSRSEFRCFGATHIKCGIVTEGWTTKGLLIIQYLFHSK